MGFNKEQLKRRIEVASKQEPADIVIKNGRVVNVFTLEIVEADVAIADGFIVGIGQYEGRSVIDAKGRYVSPAFIDAHVHIESSMVIPQEFAKVVLPHGVTTVIADPHEIANVSGSDGIRYMLDASEHVLLDVFIMLPSCVPATQFEHAGAELHADDLAPFYSHPRVLGLAEVMDYPAVLRGDDGMLDKLAVTLAHTNKIDGHAAGLDQDAINVYRAAGICTDHECVTAEEVTQRLRRGMYVLIREGSAARDLTKLIHVVNERNARRCVFCTDDKHLDDLISEGSIDHNVRLAIKHGLDPLLAIQMASLNAAECYGLSTKGAIAPGFEADFLLLDDLDQINISQVYKAGQLVADKGTFAGTALKEHTAEERITRTVNIGEITEQNFHLPIEQGALAHVIGIIPNSIVTEHLLLPVESHEGMFISSVQNDLLKLAVVERHHRTGNIGLGIVKGFRFQSGAIASTVAHDSHNIVVAGTNDADIALAVNYIKQMQGGLVVVDRGEVLASVPLEIAGLMTARASEDVNTDLQQLHHALERIDADLSFNPFLTLSFLSLPVIPKLKLTDCGLFDVERFAHISVS